MYCLDSLHFLHPLSSQVEELIDLVSFPLEVTTAPGDERYGEDSEVRRSICIVASLERFVERPTYSVDTSPVTSTSRYSIYTTDRLKTTRRTTILATAESVKVLRNLNRANFTETNSTNSSSLPLCAAARIVGPPSCRGQARPSGHRTRRDVT